MSLLYIVFAQNIQRPPASKDAIMTSIASGDLSFTDLFWNESANAWEPLADLFSGGTSLPPPLPVQSPRPDAQQIRDNYRKAENRVKSLSALFIALPLPILVIVVGILANANASVTDYLFALAYFGLFYLPSATTGIGLFFLKPWGRICGIILSIVGLLGFPIGTIIYGISLFILCSSNARYVVSQEYRHIVNNTK
jgi:hypothetical protein